MSRLATAPFSMCERSIVFAFVLGVGIAFVPHVRAADIFWNNPAGGDWNVPANWSPAQVPGLNDMAFITNNSIVTLSDSQSVARLTLNDSTLTVLNQGSLVLGIGSLESGGGTVSTQGALIFAGDSW